MAFDNNTLDQSINTALLGSFNDETNNTTTVGVEVADSFNEDNSVNDSGNLDVGVEDSFQNDSHNTDIDVDDSGNTDSYNDYIDESDNSWTDNSDNSVNDFSTNAGVRSYDTGFRDLNVGAAGGAAGAAGMGGGDVLINNQATIVDQSVNSNIAAFGPVATFSGNEAVTASGTESYAAGDDITISTSLNQATTITAGDDVNIGNETHISNVVDSYNSLSVDFHYEDNSVDVDLDNVWNDYSDNYSATDSFNDDTALFSDTDVNVDVNAVVDSIDSGIIDNLDVSF